MIAKWMWLDPWMTSLPEEDIMMLHRGKPIKVGGDIYRVCAECGKVLKINGWLKGLHICQEPE